MKNKWFIIAVYVVVNCRFTFSQNNIITSLPTKDSVVALTFDACETITPSYMDSTVLRCLLEEKIPFTLFASGKFAVRNRDELRQLSQLDFVEIENHSYNHMQHMEELDAKAFADDVRRNEDTLISITGKRPKFFRFPGGNYDENSLKTAEELNYKVVHWSFESGDPGTEVTPDHLIEWVLLKTKQASILIFHINGRGYSTGRALPRIVESLKKRGYRFVKLADYIN